MIIICIGITLIYVILIMGFSLGFDRIKTFELGQMKPLTRFSVIIPFRNEEKMLPALLASIAALNYPKDYFEIIFVDDDSEDLSVHLINSILTIPESTPMDFRVIKNIIISNSPKKDAINLAISKAKYDWIVTTDADCVLPKYWLESFDEFIQEQQPDFIVAPITYANCKGFLHNFQLLDVLSLQGATIGGFGIKKPFLCNGANLAYKKELFKILNGFQGNSEIASGDDVFLLEKATAQNASKVHYLKCQEAIVYTSALNSWADLIQQRVRWAAKSTVYKNYFGRLVGLIVLSQNALLVGLIVLSLTGVLKPQPLLYIFIIKFGIDLSLISKATHFFNQRIHLKHLLLSSLCYPFFGVYVTLLSVFKDFRWKERSYKK
ncbi:glycosyltransferase family 2 protein [Gelidibacter sp. F63206]|uniref:glycosyltransferase family 2 protein n=1 Tax=Gelidibacter sp. F63206 TaxID=2926425 RepID=UPI001FF32BA9|nr:glycosyltransferase [Gelidibacter sp. F63206]MCK0114576.1 glycosyltransferase [Gelidibacter sp. F63206]